jgi:hypothetical protein
LISKKHGIDKQVDNSCSIINCCSILSRTSGVAEKSKIINSKQKRSFMLRAPNNTTST